MDHAPRETQKRNLPWALLWLALITGTLIVLVDAEIKQEQTQRALHAFNQDLFLDRAQSISEQGRQSAILYAKLIQEISTSSMTPRQKAQAASDFNQSRLSFASDTEVWGLTDYWASPLELFDKGRGDCEDFAISAYELLINSGTPHRSLRMAYTRILLGGRLEPHMVALLADDDDFLVIDNTRSEITRLSERSDLAIVFTFDNERVYERAGNISLGDSQVRIGKWRDLLAKAKADGLN